MAKRYCHSTVIWQELAQPSQFDTAEVIFIKRMLQVALPEEARARTLTHQLFERFVAVDQATFAAELYMSADQLKIMIRGTSMYVGSHGVKHYWLNSGPG